MILSVVMIYATTGFSIVSHMCGCHEHGNSQISLSSNAPCCEHLPEENQNCCQHKETSSECCHHQRSACNEKDGKSCCNLQSIFIKTDEYIVYTQLQIEEPAVKNILCQRTSNVNLKDDSLYRTVFQLTDRLPPSSFGKNLITLIHQFKLDPFPG